MNMHFMTFLCLKSSIFNYISCRPERRDSPQQWTDFLYNFVAVISLIHDFTCTSMELTGSNYWFYEMKSVIRLEKSVTPFSSLVVRITFILYQGSDYGFTW